MWQHYRKTFIPIQLLIVTIAAALAFYWKVPWSPLLIYVAVMELAAVLGAAWARRLKRKVTAAQGFLPNSER